MGVGVEQTGLIPAEYHNNPCFKKTVQYLREATLAYKKQKQLPGFNQDGLQIIFNVVTNAFLNGLTENGLPESKGQFESILQTGFKKKDLYLTQSKEAIVRAGKSRDSLAINSDLIQAAKNEYQAAGLRTSFPSIDRVVDFEKKRSVIIPRLSHKIIKTIIAVDDDMDIELGDDIERQAMVIRGFVASSLLGESGLNPDANPLYIDDVLLEQLNQLSQQENKKVILQRIADKISLMFQDDDIDPDSVTSLIEDYGEQIFLKIGQWQSLIEHLDLQPNNPTYWEKKYRQLSLLPIEAFIPDTQFIFNPQELSNTEDKPHLWEGAITVDGYIVPSLTQIQNSLSMIQRSLLKDNIPLELVSRLKEAKILLGAYQNSTGTIVRMRRSLLDDIKVFQQYRGGWVPEDKTGELEALQSRAARAQAVLRGYEQADQEQEKVGEVIRGIDSLKRRERSNDLPTQVRIYLAELKYEYELNMLNRKIKTQRIRLDRPNMRELFLPGSRQMLISTPELAKERLAVIGEVIKMIKTKGIGLAFRYYGVDRRFVQRIASDVITDRQAKIYNASSRRRKDYQKEKACLARVTRVFRKKGVDAPELVEFIVGDLELTQTMLTHLIKTSESYKTIEQSLQFARSLLGNGKEVGLSDEEIQEHLVLGISDSEVDEFINYIRFIYVPSYQHPNRLSLDYIDQVLNNFEQLRDRYNFTIPEEGDIGEAIEAKARKITFTKPKNLFSSLSTILDNEYVHWQYARGWSLTKFIQALKKRRFALESKTYKARAEKTAEKTEAKYQKAKGIHEGVYYANKITEHDRRIQELKEDEQEEKKQLLEGMKKLDLAIPIEEARNLGVIE